MGLVAAYMVGRSEILECGTTFHWVYVQNFLSVRLTVEKESKIKHTPLNDQPPFLYGLSLDWDLPCESSLHGARIFLPFS